MATVLFSFGACYSTPAVADIFYFVAADGTSHYSDQPTDARFELLLRTPDRAPAPPTTEPPRNGFRANTPGLESQISSAARASGIEPALLHAVIGIESGYNPKAVSPQGALGLMQLMPQTARRYGVADPFDPAQNLQGGARHLGDLLKLFSNNKELALAAYNAGAGAVITHGGRIPPYAQTMRYVPAVLHRYQRLRGGAPELKD